MRNRLAVPLIAILLLSLSCTLALPLAQPKTPQGDPVATWVAETLAAEPIQEIGTPAVEVSSETEPTPGPTAEPPVLEATLAESEPLAVETLETMDNPPPAGYDPSLLRVAYAIDGELRLWTESSGEIVLYSGEPVADVLLSEDGWVVIFTTRNADFLFNGLWRVNADGSDLRRLLDASTLMTFSSNPTADGVSPYQMVFVPQTRQLAFNTRLIFMGPGLIIQDDLRLLDTSTGSLQTLLEPGLGGAFTYSPDGSQVVLVSPTSVSLVHADGTNRRSNLVTFPMIMTYSEYQYYPKVTWEADSSAAWVVVPSEDSLATDASMAFWRIPLDDGAPVQMGVYPFDLSLFFAAQVLSPDNQKTVYLSRTAPESNQWTLHLARIDGSADFPVRTGNLRFETWSPDGNWVTIEQEGEFFIGDATGNFRPLADVLPVVEVQWVDAESFLFLSGDYEAMQLRLGSLLGPSLTIGPLSGNYIPFSYSVGEG